MFNHGGKTPKYHVGYSNSPMCNKLSTGPCRGWASSSNDSDKTYKIYVGKSGKRAFTADKKNLKATQNLA